MVKFQIVVRLSCLLLVWAVARFVAADTDECRVARCFPYDHEIRYPFWLKHEQPEHCGLPGFQLFCHRGKTEINIQYLANTSLQGTNLLLSIKAAVVKINYTSRTIILDSGYEHETSSLKLVSTSTSLLSSTKAPTPFRLISAPEIVTFVSCSVRHEGSYFQSPNKLTSLSGKVFLVDLFRKDDTISISPITSCVKIFDSYGILLSEQTFNWSIPQQQPAGGQESIKPIAGIIPGSILTVLLLVVLSFYTVISFKQTKKKKLKIEMFLADYKAMKPTRYTYADIKKITRHFSDKLGQGGYGSVYKGQITNEIMVAVKVLYSDPKAHGEEFINEVGTIGRIHHVNVVRLVGYCADGCNRALVYEFQPNNSLEKFTCSYRNHGKKFLGWEKTQEIAIGIAKGIEYLHEGCAQQILHFDIKPHNILLDQNFNPKVSDFGLAKLCSKDQSIVSMTMARGTIGYIAPEVYSRNFGKVSAKSDVYSFGMLLLEMVGARENDTGENTSETYFPEWIYHRLEEGGEVAIQIDNEEDSYIAKKLTIVGLRCIAWHPVDRPSMKQVIQMLERAEYPAMPPNPFSSLNARTFTNHLESISESE